MSPALESGTISIHRSLVIRLYHAADLRSGKISGLVEHVVSGEVKEFSSVNELISSIGALLRIADVASE
jgi:hypothetical protein